MKVEEYLHAIADIDPDQIAYIDETGMDTCLYREYAYAPRGEEVIAQIYGRKYKRTSIVAAQIGKEIIAPLQYDGTMDSSLFEHWFEQLFLPSLLLGAAIVMDNAAFHRRSHLIPLAQNAGHLLIFLPPYSPELNPIEKYWSWLKRNLRKILPQYESFDAALSACFQV